MTETRKLLITAACVLLASCGTFQLTSGVIANSPKTDEQIQLDMLTCKDHARLEASTADRQVGAFLLGFTLVGAPMAFEIEKATQRRVFKSCMEARGYQVMPPVDESAAATTVPASQQMAPAAESTSNPAPPPSVQVTAPRDEAAQLAKLRELHEKGLITSQEYQQKRKEILDRL